MPQIQLTRYRSTLIELLILTGMITVMIALLLPVVKNNGRVSTTPSLVKNVPHQQSVSHRRSIPVQTTRLSLAAQFNDS